MKEGIKVVRALAELSKVARKAFRNLSSLNRSKSQRNCYTTNACPSQTHEALGIGRPESDRPELWNSCVENVAAKLLGVNSLADVSHLPVMEFRAILHLILHWFLFYHFFPFLPILCHSFLFHSFRSFPILSHPFPLSPILSDSFLIFVILSTKLLLFLPFLSFVFQITSRHFTLFQRVFQRVWFVTVPLLSFLLEFRVPVNFQIQPL